MCIFQKLCHPERTCETCQYYRIGPLQDDKELQAISHHTKSCKPSYIAEHSLFRFSNDIALPTVSESITFQKQKPNENPRHHSAWGTARLGLPKKHTTPAVPANIWTFRSSTHIAGTSLKYDVYGRPLITFIVNAASHLTPTIAFKFLTTPQKSGVYRIVENPINSNELSVFCSEGISHSYFSTGSDGALAYVQVNAGKIQILANEVRMKSDQFTNADSTIISFNLKEF